MITYIGPAVSSALPGFHAITGSDLTGRIYGVGKKSDVKVLIKSPASVVLALSQLGEHELLPSEVVAGWEQFLCMVLSSKDVSSVSPGTLR